MPANLDLAWIHGSRPPGIEPLIQVHRHDDHTYVLRQGKASSYEAPFLYLLFGNDRAILLDTGATADPTAFPLRTTVDMLITGWLAEHPRANYGLVVAHTHGHGDHVAGDAQFAARPDTEVVGTDVADVRAYFALAGGDGSNDGGLPASFDLGGRTLEVLHTPGHQRAAITIFDPWTGWLLTGDTVYRGRLYVEDMDAFTDSLDRMASLAGAGKVTAVLGCHIEMTRMPGRDYPLGTSYQPEEPPVQMSVAQLMAVREAAHAVAGRPGAHVFDDFIIYNGPCRWAFRRQRLRRVANRLLQR